MTTDQPPAPAFPFVGARAQVTVARSWVGRLSRVVHAGNIVTLESGPDSVGDYVCRCDQTGGVAYIHVDNLRPAPSPVPASPGPAQNTEPEQWQVFEHTVRQEHGLIVGIFERPEDAALAVSDHQDAPTLRAEVQRLTKRLNSMRRGRDSMTAFAESLKAERDAARAELDAAHNTDGLGLPQVGPVVRADYAWLDDDGHRVAELAPASHLRLDAAWALAVAKAATDEERARLADEATTDDKETDR